MRLPVDKSTVDKAKPNLRSVSMLEAPVLVVDTNLSTHAVYLSEGIIPFQHRVTNIGSLPLIVECLKDVLADPVLGNSQILLHDSSPSGWSAETIAPNDFRDFILYVNTTADLVNTVGVFYTLPWGFLHNGPTNNTYLPMSIRYKVVLDPPRPYIPSWFEANSETILTACVFTYGGFVLFFLVRRHFLWAAPLLRPDRFALHFGLLTSTFYKGFLIDADAEERDRAFEKLKREAAYQAARIRRDKQASRSGSSPSPVASNVSQLLGLGHTRDGSSPGPEGAADLEGVDPMAKLHFVAAPSLSAAERKSSLLAQMETYTNDPQSQLMNRIRVINAPNEELARLMERDPRAIDENGDIVDKVCFCTMQYRFFRSQFVFCLGSFRVLCSRADSCFSFYLSTRRQVL